jgi:hypothetical protein
VTKTQQGRRPRAIRLGVFAFIVGLLIAASPIGAQSATSTAMRFGMDIESIDLARKHGLDISFGTLWVGAWTQKQGWQHAESQLRSAAKHKITPVINWWYWGDDITPQCVEHGCRDARQGVWKDRATWTRMTTDLSSLIDKTMGGREVIVVLETEFNKAGVERMESFDGYLAEQIALLHRRGNVKVVLGFGNWGREHWGRFDRAIAASDYLGTQLLRSSVRESAEYLNAVQTIIDGAKFVHQRFKKPSFVVDLALSSYPAKSYEARQSQVFADLFRRMPELKAVGVRGIFYRMVADDPKFDASNYHGVAERHWGLLRADGSAKPALAVVANGIRGESVAASVSTDLQ